MKILFVVVLAVTLAQLAPSCGGGEGREIVGWVEEKRELQRANIIVINNVEYDVPRSFWLDVAVGDLVKFDGTRWTIVRKAS